MNSFLRSVKEFVIFDYPLPKDLEVENIWKKISLLRHEVYAEELKQYGLNSEQKLEDPGRHFITCMVGTKLAGYISLNPPNQKPFRVTKYFSPETLDKTVFF